MRHLWAPWRAEYVLGPRAPGCIFCQKSAEGDDLSDLVLFRGKSNFIILNTYPYNPGHLMVAPYRHVGRVEELTAEEARECFELVRKSVAALGRAMAPHGFNVGMNLGRVAGAGIEGHVHMHVVPRWNGDTNFMPVVAETRVVSEALVATYEKLKPQYQCLSET